MQSSPLMTLKTNKEVISSVISLAPVRKLIGFPAGRASLLYELLKHSTSCRVSLKPTKVSSLYSVSVKTPVDDLN